MATVRTDPTSPVRSAQSWGERFVQTRAFAVLSRCGFVARALIYGIIGVLAFDLVVGHGLPVAVASWCKCSVASMLS